MSRKSRKEHVVLWQDRSCNLQYNKARERGLAGVCGVFGLYSEAFALMTQMNEMFPNLRHWIVTSNK